jgi:hypothetical protein
MTPNERLKTRLCLELQKPFPPDLAQAVLVELGLAYGHAGKRSISYQDALKRRNEYILAAFNALPGKPWNRCAELASRIASARLGDDEAGRQLRQAEQIGAKMPTSLKMLSYICGLSSRKN